MSTALRKYGTNAS
jgi:hypothetical protein